MTEGGAILEGWLSPRGVCLRTVCVSLVFFSWMVGITPYSGGQRLLHQQPHFCPLR
jgi:hypothetical protein